MDALHKVIGRSPFFAAVGFNVLAGAYLVYRPLPTEELRTRLSNKFGGDEARTEASGDMALLGGAAALGQQAGVHMIVLGTLLAAALRSKDKTALVAAVAAITAADVAALALGRGVAAAGPVDARRTQLISGVRAAEVFALGSYLLSCTRG